MHPTIPYPLDGITASTLAGLRGASALGITMIAVTDGAVEVWPDRIHHDTLEAVGVLTLAALDEEYARLRFPAEPYSLGWLVDKAMCFDHREQTAIVGSVPPAGFRGGTRPHFSASADRIIEQQGLSGLWRRSGRSGTHCDLRPIDLEAYARALRHADSVRRITALVLLGLYNANMLRAVAKRTLRIGAVDALGILRRTAPDAWSDALMLLSHYPGW
ncbi:hypothetical protein [Azospirillum lipoferum]|uniref:Uncharacterized protein n=1 Tax=Azospirillum lipoferum (strain 4B) TaxID=862719 RepID=G7ZA16_AZOL4|nr:hypothetical protein [Azospirillum lipoferum]CBS88432.1 protein of unknown function [Azospirillum lipoferum 4B]